MTNLTLIFLAGFAFKLLWNIWIPTHLEIQYRQAKKRNQGAPQKKVSLMIGIEIFLLLLAVACSTFIDPKNFLGRPMYIFFCGVAAVVLSYCISIAVARLVRSHKGL